jgi:hypothetical protein
LLKYVNKMFVKLLCCIFVLNNKTMRTQLQDLKKELQQIEATLHRLNKTEGVTERMKKRLEDRELYIRSIIYNIQ